MLLGHSLGNKKEMIFVYRMNDVFIVLISTTTIKSCSLTTSATLIASH